MKCICDELPFFSALFDLLESNLGATAELVLYDLSTAPSPAIVDIRNGSISGGAVGFGQKLLEQKPNVWPFQEYRKTFNSIHTTSSNRVLRCSAMCIYNDEDLPIGCICINQDITKTLEVERAFHNLHQYHNDSAAPTTDIGNVLEALLEEAAAQQNVPVSEMNKEQKIEFIRYLDQHGAFLVTKAGDKVCSLLGISKYTMYAYLDIARKQ